MIYLIITTCIHNKIGIVDINHRQNRYMESITAVLSFIKEDLSIKPIIVENNGVRKTFLDDLNCDVCYTNNNDNECVYTNKGINELLDIKEVIHKYNIQDDDIVIKLTGRYKLLDSEFLHTVKENSHSFDAFIKFYNVWTKEYLKNDCVLGLFAIKCKYLKDFNYENTKSGECEFAEYVRKSTDKIMEIQELHLDCCFGIDFRMLIV